MKRVLSVFLLLCASAFAQYASIQAQLTDGSGNTSAQGFLHFELYNCGYNFPTVNGSAITPVRTSFDVKSTSVNGVIFGQILGNDQILCGGVASTQWRVTLMKDQKTALQPTQPYFIAANSTWTPAAMPATQPPPTPGWIQVFGNPNASQTIAQPVNTVLKITGTLDLTGATVIGFNGSSSGSGSVTSVALSMPSWLSVSGSPIVTAGLFAVTAASGQPSHQVLGTFTGTSVALGALATADLPFTYSGNSTQIVTSTGNFTQGHAVTIDANGNLIDTGASAGAGSVTSFSAGTLSPLFTTSVATATSTPALSFTLSTAAAHRFFGNNTGGTATPGYQVIGTADLPFTYSGSTTQLGTISGALTNGHCASFDASGNIVDSGVVGCGGTATGTVTSVAMTVPSWLSVIGTPIVTSGTLAVTGATGQTLHQVVGTAGTGIVGLLSLTTADLPFTYSGNTTKVGTVSGALTTGHTIIVDAAGNLVDSGTTGGSATVTSVAASFTGGLVAIAGTPVTTAGTLAFTVAGTSGGIPYFSSASTWASTAALTANLPIIGGGAGVAPTVGTRSGNTTKFVTTTGALTNGNCASWDVSGNIVDFGSACGGGGGGGTVTNVGFAAPTGFAVTGSPVLASGTLTLGMPSGWTTGDLLIGNGANSVTRLPIGGANFFLQSNGTTAVWAAGGTVTSVAQTFTGGLISVSGSPITSTGTLALTVAGTSGGIPYFSSASTWLSSGTLTANKPVIGGGSGVAPASGGTTGTTTTFVTSTGVLTNGHCASWDANGNLVDSGTSNCGGGASSVGLSAPVGFAVSGSPVTTAGTLIFAMPTGWTTGSLLVGNGANSVTNLGIGANGTVLKSNGSTAVWGTEGAVSSVGLSLPLQFTVTGSPVTSTGTLTAAWAPAAAHRFLGNNTAASATPAFVAITSGDLPFTYSGNSTKLATSTGTLTNGHCVSIDANGNFVDSGVLGCGSGGGGGSGTASGSSTEIQFRNSTTGAFASDATMFFTTASHTATFSNVVITGTLSVSGFANFQSAIPGAPLSLPAAGTSAIQVMTNGDFGVSNSGGALNDLFNVYESGVLTRNEKILWQKQALSGGVATMTLGNSFAYTSTATYGCTCTDQTATAACKAVPASATTVTLAGTGTDTLFVQCTGH
jgi:hypothetical protein